MKARSVLAFILAVLVMLGLVSRFFPKEGIRIGGWRLDFPSPRQALGMTEETDDTLALPAPEEQVSLMEEEFRLPEQERLLDSLESYLRVFADENAVIRFPDNNPLIWDAFFSNMESASREGRHVHVFHYGDSQIEQDRLTAILRESWQGRFGGSGAGLLPLVQTVPSPYIAQSYEGSLRRYAIFGGQAAAPHRRYAPMGVVCHLADSARVTVAPRYRPAAFRSFSRVRLLVGNCPEGFQAILSYGDQAVARSVRDSFMELRELVWQLPYATTEAELYLKGKAELYGLVLEGPSGVQVDNLPMRGCSGTLFTRMDAALLKASMDKLDVSFLILQFGGNRMPVIHNQDDIDTYAASIGRQIRFLKSLRPDAPMLFIGPSDMSRMVDGQMATYPLLPATVEALRQVCLESGVAYWDMYRAMGGSGSMIRWVDSQPALAARDYIHFTPKGADRIGHLLDESLSFCYDYYSLRRDNAADSVFMARVQREYRTAEADSLAACPEPIVPEEATDTALEQEVAEQWQKALHRNRRIFFKRRS